MKQQKTEVPAANQPPHAPAQPPVPMAPTARAVFEAFQSRQVGAYKVTKTGIVIDSAEGSERITPTYTYVRAIGRDADGDNWSILLDWKNPEGDLRTQLIPYTRLSGDWGSLCVELGRQGLIILPVYLRDFRDYLIHAIHSDDTPRVRLIQRIGCFPIDSKSPEGAWGFMLPDGPILPAGQEIEPVLFMPQLPSPVHDAYAAAGSHEEWSREVAQAASIDLWVFDVVAGIGMLMMGIGDCENFAIHTHGETSSGKTTGGRLAMSVTGKVSASSASERGTLWQTWTATANGVELLAVAHSGGGLFLDEIGATPQGVGLNVYALLHGRTKARMTDYGGMRQQFTWRLLVLSTGEISVTEKIEQEGQRKVMGGELVRMLEIPVDKLPLDETMSHAESEALALRLSAMMGEHYGTAGRHFIRALQDQYANYQDLVDDFRKGIKEVTENLITNLEGDWALKPPHRRAMRQFAYLLMCGYWASEAGSIPFSAEVVERAVLSGIKVWLQGFPGTNEHERLLAMIRGYFYEDGRTALDIASANRRDWAHSACQPDVFFHDGKMWFSPEAFEAACAPTAPKRAAKILDSQGALHRHDGDGQLKAKVTIWPDVFQGARYYALHAHTFLSQEDIAHICGLDRSDDNTYYDDDQ